MSTAKSGAAATAATDAAVDDTVRYLGAYKVSPVWRTAMYTFFVATIAVLGLLSNYALRFSPTSEGVLHPDGDAGGTRVLLTSGEAWFNYRVAEYMHTHGVRAFFRWYDHMSWYPLGRPVGSTTYPGLPYAAVVLHHLLGGHVSLNDVCVMLPAWFGLATVALSGLLALQVSGSPLTGAVALLTAGLTPAAMMRSVPGVFTPESLGLLLIVASLNLWVLSLRGPRWWPVGLLAGAAYGCGMLTWGGAVYVVIVVAAHAVLVTLIDWTAGRHRPSLVFAYLFFYSTGTAIAVAGRGAAAFVLAEQALPVGVGAALLGLHAVERVLLPRGFAERRAVSGMRVTVCRVRGVLFAWAPLLAVLWAVAPRLPAGSFYTRALLARGGGRPQDAVTAAVYEHAHWSFGRCSEFHHIVYFGWTVSVAVIIAQVKRNMEQYLNPANAEVEVLNEASRRAMERVSVDVFFFVFTCATLLLLYRMPSLPLLLLSTPACGVACGFAVGCSLDALAPAFFWSDKSLLDTIEACDAVINSDKKSKEEQEKEKEDESRKSRKKVKKDAEDDAKKKKQPFEDVDPMRPLRVQWSHIVKAVAELRQKSPLVAALLLSVPFMLYPLCINVTGLTSDAASAAFAFSQSSLVHYAYIDREQPPVLVDDLYRTMRWLRDNTPEDARVLSWWDYGYQITGIGNRTTLADGNTWNHEHIATIGKLLTSPVAEAHSLIRHVADYILLSDGDLARGGMMARIANSVYHDVCPEDPRCDFFRFQDAAFGAGPAAEDGFGTASAHGRPSPFLKRSLIFSLSEYASNNTSPSAAAAAAAVGGGGNGEGKETRKKRRSKKGKRGVGLSDEAMEELSSHFALVFQSRHDYIRVYKVMNVSEESKEWLADPANYECTDGWICRGHYPPVPEFQQLMERRGRYA